MTQKNNDKRSYLPQRETKERSDDELEQQTSLHLAVERGDKDKVSELLLKGANPNLTNTLGRTPLHIAVINKRKEIVLELLNNGSSTTVSDKNGRTPLHCAVVNANEDIICELLIKGSDPNAADKDGKTPLHFAVSHGFIYIVSELLNKGSDPKIPDNKGLTPLENALLNDKTEIVCEIQVRSDPNATDKNGLTPLHYAVRDGREDKMSEFLNRGASTSVADKQGLTPLHYAVINKRKEFFDELIKAGSDLNVADEEGFTPLHHAVLTDRRDMVLELLIRGSDPRVADTEGHTPLHCAVIHANEDIICELLIKGSDPNAADKDGKTPLHFAVSHGSIYIVSELLNKGSDPNIPDNKGLTPLESALLNDKTGIVCEIQVRSDPNATDKHGLTPLHYAVIDEREDKISEFLKRGSGPCVADNKGRTPLHYAVMNKRTKILHELLNAGSDLSVADKDGRTPLHHAVMLKRTEMFEELLNAGADPSVADKEGFIPLHVAVIFERNDLVVKLLNRGLDLNVADKRGRTPLHYAAYNKRTNIFDELLNAGADPTVADKTGLRPLHCAVIKEKKEIVVKLLKRGVDPSLADKNGLTPLHDAVFTARRDMVLMLLIAGSDPSVADEKGLTPLHYAIKNKRTEIFHELLNAGSDPSGADKNGMTPLHYAASTDIRDFVFELLTRGSDPRVADKKGQIPLHFAASSGFEYGIFELIRRGSDPNTADSNGQTPLHIAAIKGNQFAVYELISRGSDQSIADHNGQTVYDLATPEIRSFLKIVQDKDKIFKELRGLGIENVDDLRELLNENSQMCFWNRVYLVGPYSVGKSCLAKILAGEPLPMNRQSTDGIWIYMGKAGMDVDKMQWIFFKKGNAVTEVLTHMLMSMSTTKTSSSRDDHSLDGVLIDANVQTSGKFCDDKKGPPCQTEKYDDTKTTDQSTATNYDQNEVHLTEADADLQKQNIASQIDDTRSIAARTNVPSDTKSKKNEKQHLCETQKQDISTGRSLTTETNEQKNSQADSFQLKEPKFESSTNQIHPVSPLVAHFVEQKQNVWAMGISDSELLKDITSDMSHEKIHKLLIQVVEEGKYKQRVVPIDIWDFGGQKDYYMTHQLFITSRGIFVLVFNGSIDIHEHMPDMTFLPGHFKKPTVAVYLLHWVNSILAYCKRTDNGFPRIILVATHKDDKWFKRTQEVRRKQLQEQLQNLFESHAGLKHLEFQPLIYIDATNTEDPEIASLRERLMQRATEHPRWGEAMPTKWIPLELQLAQKSAQGINIISRDQLMALNSTNESMRLSERQIETFLKVQHSLGKLLFFDVENLCDFIIISPPYLVEVLRSIVTEKQFWPKGDKFSAILRKLQESGMIAKDDIYFLWGQDDFKHILPYKEYMLRILVHLDVLIAPKISFEELNSPMDDVSRFLIPCMITKENDTTFLNSFWKSYNSIVLAYTFLEEVIPPALSYRILNAFITSWDVKNYKERNTEKLMLFSDLAVVKIDKSHDIAVQVKTNRVIVSLIHAKKKEDITPTLASAVQECLTAAIVRISEFYSRLSDDVISIDTSSEIPFNIEFGVFCNSDICFFSHKEMPSSTDEPMWTCKKHNKRHEIKTLTTWFSEKETRDVCESSCNGLGRLEREQCPLPHHIRRLVTQLSLDECREIAIMLECSTQEWNDLEHQFQHQPSNDMKFTALWSCTIKNRTFSFDSLQKVLENKMLSDHIICQVFRDVEIDVSDMSDDVLDKIPSVNVLHDLSNHIGNSIMQLAIELEVELSFIQQMQHDHKNKLLEQTRRILQKWRQKKFPKPTILRLLKAFYRIGKFGHTYKILKSYC